jgi:CDP-diacylglycerol---serine O-phosphatidyltransferase
MMSGKYIIPNALTILNLLCGVTAIIIMFENQFEHSLIPVLLLGIAALFDVLDGLVAKLLKATSEFGKQLDSLADLISFGLAPSIMAYILLKQALIFQSGSTTFQIEGAPFGNALILYSSLSIAVFAALRLARFNVTTSKSSDFIGLPVPASALIVASVWLNYHLSDNEIFRSLVLNPYILLGLIVALSFLMVSKISMLSLKFEGTGFKINLWRYMLILGALLLFIIIGASSLLFIMIYYLLLSFIRNLFLKAV